MVQVRLKEVASEKGSSLTQLARDTGIPRTDLSRIANGHIMPGIIKALLISHALGVCPGEIWVLPEAA